MKKHIWITALEKDEDKAKAVFQTASKYGLETGGHFWTNDLNKMEWSGAAPELLKPETALWIIAGSVASFKDPDNRFGLSLLALMLQAEKGHGFPIIIQPNDGEIKAEELPTPLKDAEVVKPALLGPKVAAKANIPPKPVQLEYRLIPHPLPGVGLWLEIGPAKGHAWKGVMAGVAGGEIDAMGVGEVMKIPEKSILEYPMKGLKIQAGPTEYDAWAVKNELNDALSFYVRIRETPGSLLFGEFSESDDAEVFLLDLQ